MYYISPLEQGEADTSVPPHTQGEGRGSLYAIETLDKGEADTPCGVSVPPHTQEEGRGGAYIT